MNNKNLRKLIREEITQLLEDVPTTTDTPKSRLMQSPGAPFGGNLYQATGPIISNEAKALLDQWMRITKAAWQKYGEPNKWPQNVTNAAIQVGQDFEHTVGTRGTSDAQYR